MVEGLFSKEIHLCPGRGGKGVMGVPSLLSTRGDYWVSVRRTLHNWGTKFLKLKIVEKLQREEGTVMRPCSDSEWMLLKFKELGWEGRGLCPSSDWDTWAGACVSLLSTLTLGLSPSHALPGCKQRASSFLLGWPWDLVQLCFQRFHIKRI